MNCNTMTVLEAYQRLSELVNQDKGNLPLIALHSNGNTGEVYIQKFIYEVTGIETMGVLIDEEIGTQYIGISV